jgi:hypothetical protein
MTWSWMQNKFRNLYINVDCLRVLSHDSYNVGSSIFVCITRKWLVTWRRQHRIVHSPVLRMWLRHAATKALRGVLRSLWRKEIHSRCRGWSERTDVKVTFISKHIYIGTYSKLQIIFRKLCLYVQAVTERVITVSLCVPKDESPANSYISTVFCDFFILFHIITFV